MKQEEEKQALELSQSTPQLALGASATTTTVKLPPSPINVSLSKVGLGAKDSGSRQLVTFSHPSNKGVVNRRHQLSAKTSIVKVPKCSLESINSRCSLSSANDDSLATPQHHHLNSSQTHSADMSQIINSAEVELGRNYLLEPNDNLSWRSHKGGTKKGLNLDEGSKVYETEKRQMAMMHTDHHTDEHFDDLSKSFKSVEDGAGGKYPSSNLHIGGKSLADQELVANVRAQPPFMFAGIVASILGSVFFSLSFLCVKLQPDNSFLGNARTLAFRGLIISACSALSILCQNSTFLVKRDEFWIIFLRSTFGTISVYGTYCAMKYISLGDSTALVFSSPIWTSILGRIILKEPIQWGQLVALPASIFGIVLIAHPALIVDVDHLAIAPAHHLLIQKANSSDTLIVSDLAEYQHRWPGIVIALCTSLSVSCTYIVLKFRKNTSIQTTSFWLGFVMVLASSLVLAIAGQIELPASAFEWSLLIVNGIFSWLGQCVLQWAFSYESASILSVVRTLDVALTFVWSALFLDEDIYWTSIVGAIIIGLVVASIMLNNYLNGCVCSSFNSAKASEDLTCELPSSSNPLQSGVMGKSYQANLESSERPYTISTPETLEIPNKATGSLA